MINLIVNQKAFWSDDDRDVLRAIREGYIATHYAMWREQGKHFFFVNITVQPKYTRQQQPKSECIMQKKKFQVKCF